MTPYLSNALLHGKGEPRGYPEVIKRVTVLSRPHDYRIQERVMKNAPNTPNLQVKVLVEGEKSPRMISANRLIPLTETEA